MTERLRLHCSRVAPEWVDYNGHMSEAYYVLIFGHATDAFYDHIGLDAAHRAATGTSIYTVEAHINYIAEAHEGEDLLIETQLLGNDAKRMILYHSMLRASDSALLAATELMMLHVDKKKMKSSAFPPDALARMAACCSLDQPAYAGRRIALPVRT